MPWRGLEGQARDRLRAACSGVPWATTHSKEILQVFANYSRCGTLTPMLSSQRSSVDGGWPFSHQLDPDHPGLPTFSPQVAVHTSHTCPACFLSCLLLWTHIPSSCAPPFCPAPIALPTIIKTIYYQTQYLLRIKETSWHRGPISIHQTSAEEGEQGVASPEVTLPGRSQLWERGAVRPPGPGWVLAEECVKGEG